MNTHLLLGGLSLLASFCCSPFGCSTTTPAPRVAREAGICCESVAIERCRRELAAAGFQARDYEPYRAVLSNDCWVVWGTPARPGLIVPHLTIQRATGALLEFDFRVISSSDGK